MGCRREDHTLFLPYIAAKIATVFGIVFIAFWILCDELLLLGKPRSGYGTYATNVLYLTHFLSLKLQPNSYTI